MTEIPSSAALVGSLVQSNKVGRRDVFSKAPSKGVFFLLPHSPGLLPNNGYDTINWRWYCLIFLGLLVCLLHIYCIYDSDMTHGEKGHSRSHSGLDGVICVAVLYWITNHSCLLSALQRPRKSILASSNLAGDGRDCTLTILCMCSFGWMAGD